MSDEEPGHLKKSDELPEVSSPPLDDTRATADDAPPAVVQRGMQRMVEMFGFQAGPAHHPVLKGIAEHPELIDKFLDHSHSQEQQKTWLGFATVAVVIIAVLALSWLFLAYNQVEHLDAIIGAVIGLLGGFGAGVAYG